ncbi:M14 metallopeptidase family protein [Pseudoalteromonas sp. MMG022]|uniref:M14 metallopeptidase family protein n=1 Tax=Pseudoalteromonas sp. MMG022 TaxID=2909978 RepID=UPI001F22117A|nr:M14 metallopeptidase family protein [Pseudoalteromonas sp. MMG022]MCF6435481.1 M14 family metallopeptidase [Pseudoalteromonas sp. MMG022]
MRYSLALAILFIQSLFFVTAKPLDYYFSDSITFDPSIAKPRDVLGYEVGQWHVRHDQLVQYLSILAQQSERINIETIGYSHEQRPLILLTISNKAQLDNIENIRKQHLARLKDSSKDNNGPAVLWMGYSVHGNEPSGSNAAMLVAYYLAAAQGAEVEKLLDNTVILLDPSLNPDGLARFAQWANSNRGMTLSADPQHREHVEAWPSGRTNHYLFDLNRDWLLLQHPESQARIAKFHDWKPNVLTDFHEMGPNSSYFFQPGIPSRTHPLTPDGNVELTNMLASFHANALDNEQQLYFTQESFDDFYYGKGSTYPDINGSVGILFEQASSRGHVQETINGTLHFAQTIKNQLTTSLSTFAGVMKHKAQLLTYQQNFYGEAKKLAAKEDYSGYLVAAEGDEQKLIEFLYLLKQHQIEAYPLKSDYKTYKVGDVFIPLEQPQYRLIKAAFSEQKNFKDNTFYDVSGWTLPHAFNLPFETIKSTRSLKLDARAWQKQPTKPKSELVDGYAFGFSWQQFNAPKMLNYLLKNGIEARVALEGFSAKTTQGISQFKAGSVIIAAGLQNNEKWLTILNQAQNKFDIDIAAIQSGLTSEGIDLGSRFMRPVQAPKVLLVGGEGVSQYELGEVWYHLDKHLELAPSIVEQGRLSHISLDEYSHIILVDGSYSEFTEQLKSKLKQWTKAGGVIWGHKRGAKWLVDNQLVKAQSISRQEMSEQFDTKNLSYKDRDHLSAKQRIAGAIFATHMDLSHPLSFGLQRELLPVFKNSTWLLKPTEQPFLTVGYYLKNPQLAGYTAPENVEKIANNASVIAHRFGRGSVIAMTDNPVFRGYWYGTSRVLTNALFFGGLLTE